MGLFSGMMGNAADVSVEKLNEQYGQLLCNGERIEIGFKVIRDTFIFTNKRFILIDKQGLTGKKVQFLSIPYRSISRYSIETAGHFDLDAEFKIWIGNSIEPLKRKFNKSVNIYDVQKVLSNFVLA